MRRVLIWVGVPLALGLLVGSVVYRTHRGGPPCLQAQAPTCKPEAPIAVTLSVPDGGTSGVVRATFSLRPVLELADLDWSFELSPDVRLVEGAQAGAGATPRGELTEGEVGLLLPNDGRHHTARLVVTGRLRDGEPDPSAPAEPELVTVVRTLSWGEPDPVTPTTLSPDADTGTLVEVAVVPTTHVPAPAAAQAGRK
jgi:hypothetical protein